MKRTPKKDYALRQNHRGEQATLLGSRLSSAWREYEARHGLLNVQDAARMVRERCGKPFSARQLSLWKRGLNYPSTGYDQMATLAKILEVGAGWLGWGGHGEWMPGVPPAVPCFGKGVHIAPFFSPSGALVLVTTRGDHVLQHLAEVGQPDAGTVAALEEGPDETTSHGHPIHSCGARVFFAPGLHRAPWIPTEFPNEGITLLAIGEGSKLIASMDAADLIAAKSATRELGVLYEMHGPAVPYSDGYGHEDDDSAEDFGEEWKRG